MDMPTKPRTYTYHPTIDCDEPNVSFNQSPSRHIPIMNVRPHGIIQNKTKPWLAEAKTPQPSSKVVPPLQYKNHEHQPNRSLPNLSRALGTSNTTHNLLGLQSVFSNQNSRD